MLWVATFKILDVLHIKIDKQLASGEYFLKEKEKRLKAQEEKKVHVFK